MNIEKGDIITLLMDDELLVVYSVDEENKTFEVALSSDEVYFQEFDLLLVDRIYKEVKEL